MISVVVPILDETKNIKPLYDQIVSVFSRLGNRFEIIFVNDGSRDRSQEEIEALYLLDPGRVRAIQFRHNFGKAAALYAGFKSARGDIIATIDGDLQDDPEELPALISKLDEGYDLVSGWKNNRKDSFVKNITSKLFNAATNLVSRVKLHDFNCGMKVYRSEVAKGLNLYGELHRYIPVLASSQGYRVCEVKIEHRRRINGHSKYNGFRFVHGFLDLITVLFITRFRARPLHLFGYLGMGFFILGFFCALYLTGVKFVGHQAIGERPLLLFSVMLMIMGVQICVTGLVGEQITTMIHKHEDGFVVKKTLEDIEARTVSRIAVEKHHYTVKRILNA